MAKGFRTPRPTRYAFGEIHRITAIQLAHALHAGQTRKGSDTPYVEHPKAVAGALRRYGYPRFLQDAGWAHDFLEDVDGLTRPVLALLVQDLRTYDAVVAVTDVYTAEAFPTWNRKRRKRAEAHRLATVDPFHRALKLADIMDNAGDPLLVEALGRDFAEVWVEEHRYLFGQIAHGITTGIAAAADAALTRAEKLLTR
jgi:(p)ppGpp synthase/HD superfamily hydrolase